MKPIFVIYVEASDRRFPYRYVWSDSKDEVTSYIQKHPNKNIYKVKSIIRYEVRIIPASWFDFIRSTFLEKSFDNLQKAAAYRDALIMRGIFARVVDKVSDLSSIKEKELLRQNGID